MITDQPSDDQEFREENEVLKTDVKKVILTNLLFVVLLVGLFFLNRQYGFLDKLKIF